MAYFFYCLECMFKQNKNKNLKKKNVQEMSWITKKQPDMSQKHRKSQSMKDLWTLVICYLFSLMS
jgi:hypothetical protein